MPHADTSLVPADIKTKEAFYSHVTEQLGHLISAQRDWVINLSLASSLLFNAFLNFPSHFGPEPTRAVNWAGFYLIPSLYPSSPSSTSQTEPPTKLLLAPFQGSPACQYVSLNSKSPGVCATSFLRLETQVIRDVHEFPGHIACDGNTMSEIVVPLVVPNGEGGAAGDGETESGKGKAVGVLDIDCLALGGFGEVDRNGLEEFARVLIAGTDFFTRN